MKKLNFPFLLSTESARNKWNPDDNLVKSSLIITCWERLVSVCRRRRMSRNWLKSQRAPALVVLEAACPGPLIATATGHWDLHGIIASNSSSSNIISHLNVGFLILTYHPNVIHGDELCHWHHCVDWIRFHSSLIVTDFHSPFNHGLGLVFQFPWTCF